jgi:hypothetical protein
MIGQAREALCVEMRKQVAELKELKAVLIW